MQRAHGETPTQCPYCGVGCGLLAETAGGRLRRVFGDPLHPVNSGRTCRKPIELPAAVHAEDRACRPLWREDRETRFTEKTWDGLIGRLAQRLQAIRERHGPDAIAFYISGQLLTEDYYAVNKLVKGFLGTNNVDSNSRLCMSSAVAGYRGAFGSDGPPPGYADLDRADCLLLLGSNAAACHPIVWGRICAARSRGAFVICADPRETATARGSDLHLPVRPGSDLALLNAMLHVIVRDGLLDEQFIAAHTSGFELAAAVAAEWPPERAAEQCAVAAADIERAARAFGRARRAMTLWSMGANQSTVGTLKNRALINLCLATGQIGKPGAGPLSLTGQPNAMGGRETGGLAQLLPGYRSVESQQDRAEIERLWGCPPISPTPGLPAVELFDALVKGSVKAVWIVATNPLVSLPHAQHARQALERAELVVVQDAYHPTETSALAHAVLPAAAWPEKAGTMTNSERRVSLLRRLIEPPGEALADWQIFARLGAALGHSGSFAWQTAADVFAEFAGSTAGRVCDMSGLSHERLEHERGLQWPCPAADEPHPGSERLYGDLRFPTPDGRARFAPTPHAGPAERPTPERPLVLTTGRVAHHWHTLTRTGKSPVLNAVAREPLLTLHPADARTAGVGDGELALVSSARGETTLRVEVSETMPEGVAFAPMHWGALHAPRGAGSVNALTHGERDPVSRQPELKAATIRVEPLPADGRRRRAPTGERRRRSEIDGIPDRLPASRERPRRLVVVGTGMAGLEVVQELLERRPGGTWQITMLGEEPVPPYNRVLLSKLLAATCEREDLELRCAAWYAERGIDVRTGVAAVKLDTKARCVIDACGERHGYDALVLATGSRPFVPPVEGHDLPHVHGFRTLADVERICAGARAGTPAVIVGGGLLGLEAAAGLLARGMTATVVELSDRVMPQQLDAGAAGLLKRKLAALDMRLVLGCSVAEIELTEVVLRDGERLPASLVVLAAGVRPETTLARDAGIEVGRGVQVDDEMRSSAPAVWAVGECAEHRGVVQGLWAPVAEQARVAGAAIAGDPAGFHGATPATSLKVAGVELFAGGSAGADVEQDELVHADTRRGVYRKLVLDGERLAGAMLVGDTSERPALSALLRSGDPVPEAMLAPGGDAPVPLRGDAPVPPGDQVLATRVGGEQTVCSCNAVTRETILTAIASQGLQTLAEVARATRASTGCGSCAPDLEALLAEHAAAAPLGAGSSDRNVGATDPKPTQPMIAV